MYVFIFFHWCFTIFITEELYILEKIKLIIMYIMLKACGWYWILIIMIFIKEIILHKIILLILVVLIILFFGIVKFMYYNMPS